MRYEILSHSADEKFRAKGETLEEAFKQATAAFSEILKGDQGSTKHTIQVESESHEALLFDYLERLIFLQDTEGVAVSYAEKVKIQERESGYTLEAEVKTDPITAAMNYTDIKAPTYNEMRVEYEEGEGWVLEAVLDI
jgi:SHS2 domain-containing protein